MRLLNLCIAVLLAASGAAARAPDTAPRIAIDADFPDPTLLRAADGYYYVHATQGGGHNIQVARSRDLKQWDRLPDALPIKPGWAKATQDFWAPHVSAHDGRYYLYYSAKPDAALTDTARGLCLAVATADRPQGPFTDIGKPLLCGEGFVNIDPMAYDDPATGKRLLYWGSGFKPIKVQELARDRVSFAPGSAPVDLLPTDATDDPANYRRLVEGAWVTRRKGWYYLFYSGDNCCGPQAHYGTLVARSRKATGPFEVVPPARGGLVIAADARWLAPGHNAVITDAKGRHWTAYHAIDRRQTGTPPNSRRIMLIAPVEWRDGLPVVAKQP
ncbi:glycoside hydrolase family 43 protein [Glacieibacterium frigidum]|uniref:Family 43 glycosylhydrolase n=1 Tax=Glacieibacterium frigidum TaxID=2593303 RepID=A0A552U9X1_9SPHN|nr:glycoside hydrolase family 43 protein [Glacieibacterium frigidum]TRW15021.1 family 43 glycosylhydrolase [Glacieibacterium frigidum]